MRLAESTETHCICTSYMQTVIKSYHFHKVWCSPSPAWNQAQTGHKLRARQTGASCKTFGGKLQLAHRTGLSKRPKDPTPSRNCLKRGIKENFKTRWWLRDKVIPISYSEGHEIESRFLIKPDTCAVNSLSYFIVIVLNYNILLDIATTLNAENSPIS